MGKNSKHLVPRNVDPSLESITLTKSRPSVFRWIGKNSLPVTLILIIIPNLLAFYRTPLALLPGQPGGMSLLVSCAAAVLCSIALDRLQSFPDVTRFHYVMPVLPSVYAIAIAFILFFRLNYSIFVLGLSFLVTVLAHLAFFVLQQRTSRPFQYYVAAGGRADEILLPGDISLIRVEKPAIPIEPGAVIVADLHHDHDPHWLRVFAQAALLGIPVFHITEIIETITGRVQIDHISENHFGSLLISGTYASIKRLVDTLIAIVMLVLLAPLLGIVAVIVRFDSPGPAIFRQQRVGFRGKVFEVFKFRTMTVQPVVDERASAMTQQDDVRITRIGRFLRRSRIDELPQLVNVLRGDMSIIGPRPEALALSRWYLSEIPFYEYRHIVRPGITGWAQVNQGHVTNLTDVRDKLHYDFFYIKNFSYWIDMLILLQTVRTILTGYGSK